MTDTSPINEMWRFWTFMRPEELVAIEWDGILYPSLRNALVATMTPDKQEREHIASIHPLIAAGWAVGKPSDPAWRAIWEDKIKEWTLLLTAQKYGLIHGLHEYGRRLKFGMWLSLTAGRPINYHNTQCDTIWGRCFCRIHSNGMQSNAKGQNMLGTQTQTVRGKIVRDMIGDPLDRNCRWCRVHRRNKVTPARSYILYVRDGNLVRYGVCDRHMAAERQEAKQKADFQWFFFPIDDYPADVRMQPSIIVPSQPPVPRSAHRHTQTHLPGWTQARNENWNREPASPAPKDTWGSMVLNAKGVVRTDTMKRIA